MAVFEVGVHSVRVGTKVSMSSLNRLYIVRKRPNPLRIHSMNHRLPRHILPPRRSRNRRRSPLLKSASTFTQYSTTHLHPRIPDIQIRIPSLIRAGRILHNDRIRHRIRYRIPTNLKPTRVICPPQRHTRDLCRATYAAHNIYQAVVYR